MPAIRPFRGWIIDPRRVDPGEVITPPYDIIPEHDRLAYRRRSARNLIHVILPEDRPGDRTGRSRYANARAALDRLVAERVYVEDRAPALYLFEQEAPTGERRVCLVAEVDLREHGRRILPHERTFRGPREDRRRLLRALGGHVEMPLVLYPDLHREASVLLDPAMKGTPIFSFTDPTEIRYALWRIVDPRTIRAVTQALERREVIIADGHHRIEMSVEHMRRRGGAVARWMPMALANLHDEPAEVAATHRLVHGLPRLDVRRLEADLVRTSFDLEIFEYDRVDEEMQLEKMKRSMRASPQVIGMHHRPSRRYYALRIKDVRRIVEWVDAVEGPGGLPIRKMLDVSWVHSLILRPLLGIRSEDEVKRHLHYVKGSVEDALKRASEERDTQLVFFLNPLPLRHVTEIARGGDTVPQKTTYFYPKVDSGLVLRLFR